MIHSIKLLHWKSHEKTEIAFSKGTNVLVGPMGAGKTSIVDALSFALYGTFPSLKSRKVTLEEIVMQRPEKHGDAKVEVVLETSGKKYALERMVSRGGAKAFLMEGGKIIETGPARVNEAVERLLRTDYELFARTIYADQNNIDAFLSLASGERKRQIDELLGLDKFEKARAGAGAAANKLKAMKAEAERAMAGVHEGELRSELEQAVKEAKQLSAKLEEARKEAKELEGQAGFRKEKMKKLEGKQAEHAALSGEASGARAALKSLEENCLRVAGQLEKKLSEKEVGEKLKKNSSELAEQLDLRKRVEELLPTREKMAAEVESMEKRLAVLARQTDGKNAGELKKELKKLKDEIEEAKKEEKELSERQAQLAAELAVCLRAEIEKRGVENLVAELEKTAWEKTSLLKQAGEKELEKKLLQAEEAERSAGARVTELDDAIAKLGASHSNCIVCDSPLSHEKAMQLVSVKKSEMEAAKAGLSKNSEERRRVAEQIEKAKLLHAELEKTSEKLVEGKKTLEKAAGEAGRASGLKAEVGELSKQLTQATGRFLELVKKESEIAVVFSAAAERGELEKHLSALQPEEKKISASLSEAQSKYSEEKRGQLEKETRLLEKNKELLHLEGQAEKARQKLSEAERNLAKLGFNARELEAARAEFVETERNLAAVKVMRESGEKMLSEKQAREKELAERVAAVQRQAARLKKLEASISSVAKFQNSVSEAQGHLRSELVQAVNEAAGLLWKSIYPYADFQSVKLNAGEQDYSVELLANTGEWVPAEHASGGERTCASLSLRIAFATVLTPQLSLLVLDEPTHNLDTNAIAAFCRTLREELPKIVEQTFIITHDEALKEGANAAVYKIERDKDKGDKSTVEKLSVG